LSTAAKIKPKKIPPNIGGIFFMKANTSNGYKIVQIIQPDFDDEASTLVYPERSRRAQPDTPRAVV
jgi:hypothetical protein